MSDEGAQGDQKRKRAAFPLRALIVQLGVVLGALLLGGLLWSSRVAAKPHGAGRSGHGFRIAAKAASPSASASGSSSASALEPAPAPAAASASASAPIDWAVPGPDGVPQQTEGRYRSPFANPKQGHPIIVKVGFLLSTIRNYDIKAGTFDADFYLTMWAAEPIPDFELAFANNKEMAQSVKIADKPTFKMWRFVGTFHDPPDLRQYPFDQQELNVEIEAQADGTDEIQFEPVEENTHLDTWFDIIGWDVTYLEAKVLSHGYPDRFPGDDLYYHRYEMAIGVERPGTNAIFTVYVPAFVIVFISLMGMWIPPTHMEVRSNAGPPMLAAAVLFHFALEQALPPTEYLTRADKLMIGVYVVLSLCTTATWAFFLVDEEKGWDRVFRLARAVVPPVSIAVMVIACFL